MNRKALGKGINALIPEFEMGVPEKETSLITELLIDEISPNRMQWRNYYDDEKLYYDLYEYYSSDPDYMPYGTQKARDGDPTQWITEHLDYLGLLTPVEHE